MKLIVFVSGLLLHFLLLHWTESVKKKEVPLESLEKIIDFFEQNYTIKTAEGNLEPYAIAINVPRNQCESFNHSNFLNRDNTKTVKDAIYKSDSHFYKGNDLIAAGPHPLKDCKINPVCYLLQNESSSFNELLKRRTNSCVVIYSVYSPCQNMSVSYNITPALETLKNHSGIKAFVFSKVDLADKNDHTCYDLANCTEIAKHVHLCRFVNKAVSKLCQSNVSDVQP